MEVGLPEFSSGRKSFHWVKVCMCVVLSLRILVNRGWVPRNKLKPETRREAQVVITVLIFSISYFMQRKIRDCCDIVN